MKTSTHARRSTARASTVLVSQRVGPAYGWIVRQRTQRASRIPTSGLPRVTTSVKGIRRRRPKDLGACARLLRVVFSEGQYPVYWPEAPRAWLADADVLDAWIAEREREILGHITISKVGQDPVSASRWREVTGRDPSELAGVSRFFVRPRLRGQGIGAALLDVAVDGIRERGLVPVLDVVSASADAIKLYEDRGWLLRAMYPWGASGDKLRIYYFGLPPEPPPGRQG